MNTRLRQKLKGYAWRTDMSVILMGFKGHAMAGIDLARAIRGTRVWIEGAYVKPDFFGGSNVSGGFTDDTGYTSQ